jgi:hypothetical protein
MSSDYAKGDLEKKGAGLSARGVGVCRSCLGSWRCVDFSFGCSSIAVYLV